jgi:hypothetical protein
VLQGCRVQRCAHIGKRLLVRVLHRHGNRDEPVRESK